jgi:nucleotide-binding universal stress UspA family protein
MGGDKLRPPMAGRTPPSIPKLDRVLAITDFSDVAATAIPYAYALVGRGGAVHLLHVVEPLTLPNPLYAHYSPGRTPTAAEREVQLGELRERLAQLVPSAARRHGVETLFELAEGQDVAEQVLVVADRVGADALCLASCGHGGLVRKRLGPVAEALLRDSRLPLFLVPTPGR